MFDYMFGDNNYPYDAMWFERNKPLTVDDIVTFEGAVPFKYRKVKKSSRKDQTTQGLKEIKYDNIIRTKYDLNFKAKDTIKVGNKVYTIASANKVDNDTYKDAKIIYKHFDDYETELVLE